MAYIYTGKSLYDILKRSDEKYEADGVGGYESFKKDIESILSSFNKEIIPDSRGSTMPLGKIRGASLRDLLPREDCKKPLEYNITPSIHERLDYLGLTFERALKTTELNPDVPDILAVCGRRHVKFPKTKHTRYDLTLILPLPNKIYLAFQNNKDQKLVINDIFFGEMAHKLYDLILPELRPSYPFKVKSLLAYINQAGLDKEK